MKQLYIDNEYLLYPWPCRLIDEVELGGGRSMRAIAFRDMDVPTPPEIEDQWVYETVEWTYYGDE